VISPFVAGSNPTPVANAKNAQQLAVSWDEKREFAGDASTKIRARVRENSYIFTTGCVNGDMYGKGSGKHCD